MKAVPDKDEDGVDMALDTFCESCAIRKLPGQKNWIILKQYTLEQLGDVYDSLGKFSAEFFDKAEFDVKPIAQWHYRKQINMIETKFRKILFSVIIDWWFPLKL